MLDLKRRKRQVLAALLGIVFLAGAAGVSAAPAVAGTHTDWTSGGFNIANTRSNPFESTISTKNANRLAVKWTFTTHGDVSATPAVVDGAVYFPDWGGYLNKVNAADGRLIWSHQIAEYDGIAGSFSRSSPAVSNGLVYIGDWAGARLIAVSARTGTLVWIRQLESHPAALLTQSPVVFGGVVYEGVSSQEAALAANASYACCSFRGSLTASDARTGAPLWQTYMLPDNGGQTGGYSGGAVWGGTPVLDPKHRTVYVTTGQNYQVPQTV